MAEVSKRAAQVRKKQLLILGAVGAAIAVLSVGASVWLQPAQKSKGPTEVPKTKQLSLGGSSTDKDAWRIQSSAELDKMAKRLQELERSVSARDAADKRNKSGDGVSSPQTGVIAPPMPEPTGGVGGGMFSQVGVGQTVPPPTRPDGQDALPPLAPAAPAVADVPRTPRIKSVSIEPLIDNQVNASKAGRDSMVNSAREFGEKVADRRSGDGSGKGAAGKERFSDDDPLAYNRAAGRTAETYLPAGTFVRASLLNGLDAPTGGQAQQNPHPVLLRLEDNAQLPNAVRANLKGCFVTGSGHGDLSAERAYVRLDRLTCVDENGGAIDVAVRGYVSGEDGKTGMRGRLITKSGQLIANALFTGMLSGFGEAMRQGATTTNTAPVTGAQTQTVNNALEYGVGTGVGKAMDRISQYYIKLADKLFPIVEVDGGRVVDIVLTRGVSIERK